MRPLILTFLALAALAASAAAVWQLPCAAAESEGTEAKADVYQDWPFDAAEAKRRQLETARRLGIPVERTLDLGGGVKLELVLIPAGKFLMGTPEPESPWIGGTILGTAGLLALILLAVLVVRAIRQRRGPQFSLRWLILLVAVLGVVQYGGFRWWRAAEAWENFDTDESPAHEVALRRPYYMGKYEVTQEEYERVMGATPSYFKGRDLPVDTVSWDGAQAFCKKIGEKTGESVRLPSEAEWEYACRAGTRTRFCSGDADADLESVAWYSANSSGTHPVGGKASNAWGVHDMHGNVWEWCADWYGNYGTESVVDPQGPTAGPERVLRGGSWLTLPRSCRSANRNWSAPVIRIYDSGFRVVISARTP